LVVVVVVVMVVGKEKEEGGIWFLLECLRICLCTTFSFKLLMSLHNIFIQIIEWSWVHRPFIGPSPPPDYIALDPTLGSFYLFRTDFTLGETGFFRETDFFWVFRVWT
jgi:hypothetical protein